MSVTTEARPLHHVPKVRRLHTLVDATREALANPGDTKQAFRVVDALAFGAPARITHRFRATPTGRRRLRERRRLLDTLGDRAALLAMPDGSFGRAYLAFLDREGITPDGLVQASVEGREHRRDPDEEFVQEQLRDMHDLWHTLTGYRGDLLGEAAVLAFSFAQTRHLGVGFLSGLGIVLSGNPEVRRFIFDGFRRGRRAAWLPAQDWEALLPLPLGEVRARLGIEPVSDYAENGFKFVAGNCSADLAQVCLDPRGFGSCAPRQAPARVPVAACSP